jgi:AcrR family transcriptional regulator
MTESSAGVRAVPAAPSLRQRHRQVTQETILRATADIVAKRGFHAFTVQEVANRAGVSHRSVYRYFPTREALVDALYGFGEQAARRWADRLTPILEDVPDLALNTFPFFEKDPNLIRASVIARLTTGYQPPARIKRTKSFETGVRRLTRNLSPEEFRRTFAVLRLLASSNAWLVFREDFGLSGEEMTQAVSWAFSVLIEDLKRRNRAAGRKRKGRN